MHAGFFALRGICDVIKPRLHPYPRSSLRSRTTEKLRNVTKPRRVSPPARRKKVQSFSPATCTAEKIPLGSQTCALGAFGVQCVRCSELRSLPQRPQRNGPLWSVCLSPVFTGSYGRAAAVRQSKNSVTSQNPAAEAAGGCSLSKNLVEFRRRSGERKSNHFLRRHVRRRKYFSACKRASCPSPRTASAMQSGRKPLCQKSNTFLTVTKTPLPKQRGLLICGCSAGAQTMRLSRT